MKHLFFLLLPISTVACATMPPTKVELQPVPPLGMLTRMSIPAEDDTVAKAASFLLEPAGYHLAEVCTSCPTEAKEISEKPVSPLALRPQLTTIRRALVLVGGSRTRIIIDETNRRVAYGWNGAQP
jgi:hypothetical protein